ncbi:hypothetical protein C8Q74DRAFT_1216052 [Fomes fomentarius]|nr:hypothetical protein C8Q74DRAFT_1216052 [Fomes fomentarius]
MEMNVQTTHENTKHGGEAEAKSRVMEDASQVAETSPHATGATSKTDLKVAHKLILEMAAQLHEAEDRIKWLTLRCKSLEDDIEHGMTSSPTLSEFEDYLKRAICEASLTIKVLMQLQMIMAGLSETQVYSYFNAVWVLFGLEFLQREGTGHLEIFIKLPQDAMKWPTFLNDLSLQCRGQQELINLYVQYHLKLVQMLEHMNNPHIDIYSVCWSLYDRILTNTRISAFQPANHGLHDFTSDDTAKKIATDGHLTRLKHIFLKADLHNMHRALTITLGVLKLNDRLGGLLVHIHPWCLADEVDANQRMFHHQCMTRTLTHFGYALLLLLIFSSVTYMVYP